MRKLRVCNTVAIVDSHGFGHLRRAHRLSMGSGGRSGEMRPRANANLGLPDALARALSARLRVVHVLDSPYDYPDVAYGHVSGDVEELQERWHKVGQEVIERAMAKAQQAGCTGEPCLID